MDQHEQDRSGRLEGLPVFSVFIPTYNAERHIDKLMATMRMQRIQPHQVIVVDSSSLDRTRELCRAAGWDVHLIKKQSFNHGGTRNLALDLSEPEVEVIIYLTQDVLLSHPDTLANLIRPFADNRIAAVYGRQLPHLDANPLAAYSRSFNYGEQSETRRIMVDGANSFHMTQASNAFSAYRRRDLRAVGGFPSDVILGEDVVMFTTLLLNGYKTRYEAGAEVNHSHNYSLKEEAGRYFDIGVFHQKNAPLFAAFARPSGNGARYAVGEMRDCLRLGLYWPLRSIVTSAVKIAFYKLGKAYNLLPRLVCRRLSMTKGYWL